MSSEGKADKTGAEAPAYTRVSLDSPVFWAVLLCGSAAYGALAYLVVHILMGGAA